VDRFDQLCDEVLSLIEYDETSLLNWGFVEVENDLDRRMTTILNKLPPRFLDIWLEAQEQGRTFEDILQNLLDRRLIFRNSDGLYRTRYAETIRLLALLRQRFDYNDWSTGPRLVGDARIQLQRRRYPKRDISYETLVKSLDEIGLDTKQLQSLRVLTQDRDGHDYHLAAFQQRAIHTQLRLLKGHGEYGVVVGAGTGSGKTKAFYIPALTWLASTISDKPHVSIMAIYPRIELLKDQFAEAARETERLNKHLHKQGKRQISLGAYYGDTPRNSNDTYTFEAGKDWVAPFFRCPNCDHDLVWRVDDRQRDNTVLKCTNSDCGYWTDRNHILLTRQQMQQTPPDILFTTTEMLNRRLARVSEGTLFGIRAFPPPRLLLLDEIHTYEGISGANVAYLLRRWRKACGYGDKRHSLCIVGLSATLSQATETFAKLTGLRTHHVFDIHPQGDELEEEGMEYNVVLKGDPAAGTSLLSTSIQTAMLLGRTLEPLNHRDSFSYPPKIFAFCNRLDTVNRWYDFQVDAEREKVLSQYRLWDGHQEEPLRGAIQRAGQNWHMFTLIGHDLRQPMTVSRTSSQVKGVLPDAKLVIATSALEVGFNDPQVGAVIQHQTPYGMASFLQRKGRAGRDRRTRPWTVVITSAYGRDRWAFQHAEILFNPVLPLISLPIENYYVRKIQAAYVLMDWLAHQLRQALPKLDVWSLLSGQRGFEQYRHEVARLLQRILDDASVRDQYEAYLRDALGLIGQEYDAIVRSLLWGEPRPILLEVVPTLIRQLSTNWHKVILDGEIPALATADEPPSNPMPEFVPSSLFSDLNLPEIRIHLGNYQSENAQFVQTFEEILPGKVTKRYLPPRNYGADGLWIGVPDDLPPFCPLDQLSLEYDPIPITLEASGQSYRIKRPTVYHLTAIPLDLGSSSTAFPLWRSSFQPKSIQTSEPQPFRLKLQRQSSWQDLIGEIEVYSQAMGTAIQVTRGLIGVQISHLRRRERFYRKMLFVEQSGDNGDTESAGIGYTLDVDGLCIKYRTLDLIRLKRSPNWDSILRSSRPLLYLHRLEQDPKIQAYNLTPFELDWLWQIIRSALTAIAIETGKTLREARDVVERKFAKTIEDTMNVLFQGQGVTEDDQAIGRVHDALNDRLHNTDLKDALLHHAEVLWESYPEGLDEWLGLQYAASLGAAFYTALSNLVEDIDTADLRLDIEHDQYRFWITESVPGGIGLIARIVEAAAQQPRRLELQLLDTVRHCDREHLALELNTIASLVREENSNLAEAFAAVRARQDFISLSDAKQQLTRILDHRGIPATRPLVVAVNSKFLRPNSNEDTDNLIVELIDLWRLEQERLGCDIDLRVFAVAINRRDFIREQLDAILRRIGGGRQLGDNQRFNLLQSMLWMDCKDSCEDCIKYDSRYQPLARPSRHLLRALIERETQVIDYGTTGWRDDLVTILSSQYEAVVRCDYSELSLGKQAVVKLLTEPVEVGLQLFFPTVERIERGEDHWLIHVILREMVGV
jgi:predicted RNA-binding Zn-ribbon protein involved in translation (DUF1610 family)